MPARFVLVYQDQRVPLRDGEILVGRSMACHVRFNAPTVSRQHVLLHVVGDDVVAENLSSSTGTLLNGRRLTEPTPLHPGDTLTMGPRAVTLERATAADAALAAPPRPALGLLPDGEDDEITINEDVPVPRAISELREVEFHTCPACRARVPFERAVCDRCGHVWPGDGPSARMGQVTSRNVADEVPMPADVMAVYASDAMTIDIVLTEITREGAFVPTELLDIPGSACELTLLPDGQAPLTIHAAVSGSRTSGARGPAGLELRFTQMSEGTRLWLELYARRRAKTHA